MEVSDFWSTADRAQLATVLNYGEMANVAMTILERMRRAADDTGRLVTQICGPMSTGGLGSLNANMARFKLAIERAQGKGLLVFDQMPFQASMIRLSMAKAKQQYDWDILEIFYRKIFESGHIGHTLFLPGWEGSTGTKWERELVTSIPTIVVEEYPVVWLE